MDKDWTLLVEAARTARLHAYAPYSRYLVGAAVITSAGKIYPGANVENASYPVGLCAERVALFSAVAAGEREFAALAVVTEDGGTPCGACRQAVAEFGGGIQVVVADSEGTIGLLATIAELLPGSFTLDPHRGTPPASRFDPPMPGKGKE
jgi:cytidine deaminase